MSKLVFQEGWEQGWDAIFSDDPKRGAEYLGEITRISIVLDLPNEANVRARLAARYAGLLLDRGESPAVAATADGGQ